jgi:hypothetical protein
MSVLKPRYGIQLQISKFRERQALSFDIAKDSFAKIHHQKKSISLKPIFRAIKGKNWGPYVPTKLVRPGAGYLLN